MRTIGKADGIHGLYLLSLAFNHTTTIACSISATIWYHRLGHLSLKRLSSMKSILGLSDLHSLPCHICPIAKQRRLSFPFNNNVADAVFDLIVIFGVPLRYLLMMVIVFS